MKRNPQIEFFLQAEKAQKKNPVTRVIEFSYPVREHFCFKGITFGLVDDAMRKQHPQDYAAFKEYIETHDDVYVKAREQVGVPVKVDYGVKKNGSKQEKEA